MNDFLKYLYNPTTIALVLGGILTSFFGFLAGISKSEQTPKWIAWGAFIAGFIVLGAGFLSGYQDQLTAESSRKKSEQIEKISQKNAELALINSELNKKIANTITGGNSYGYFLITNPSASNIVDLMLTTEGEYPLYDVEIKIHDIEKRIDNLRDERQKGIASNLSLTEFYKLLYKSSKIIKIGNIGPNQGYPFGTLRLPNDADKKTYHIEIFARNGRVLQFVQFRRIQGKWKWAEKTIFNGEVVGKHIPSDFPQDDDSKFIMGE
jgi:hypothetical protein